MTVAGPEVYDQAILRRNVVPARRRTFGREVMRTHGSIAAVAAAVALAVASNARAQPEVVGQWAAPVAWPLVASHAALVANGRVLLWSDQPGVTPRIWDPATGNLTNATTILGSLAGSSQTQLPDGTVMIAGGRDGANMGLHNCGRYDVATSTWTQMAPLLESRNEPTLVVTGDARALAIAGDRQPGLPSDIVEAFAQGGLSWLDFDAVLALPRTPWAFVLSTGDVLVAGPEAQTRRLDLDTETWFAVSALSAGSRDGGSAVVVPGSVDRILVTGGRNPGVASCEVLDLQAATSWAYTGAMARARRHHQATLLADGSVLVTGGTLVDDAAAYAVLAAERWQPSTGTWSTLASMTVPRRRGSVALLLPDGRVLCAGGGDGTPGSETHLDAEVFSPPYLFRGSRPAITTAPASLVYGSVFTMDSPQAGDIEQVWFVRAGAATRGFDTSQRAVSLAFTAAAGRLTVTAPPDSNVAPPGTYMVFLVSGDGVPSLARLMLLQRGVAVPVVPEITSVAPATTIVNAPFTYIPAATGSAPVTWSLPSAPTWLGVSPTTGAVAGVPPTTGQFTVRLRATNSVGFDEQQWTLQVLAAAGVRTVSPLGTPWRYFKGTLNPPSDWTAIGFPDASWPSGPSGFGFSDNDDATVLNDMLNNYTTVFTRHTFSVYNVNTVSKVSVLYDYDDGFAVFLNGTRILARNAPSGTISNTSVATTTREATGNLTRSDFTDAATRALLVNGTNVVAAVGLNRSLSNSDFTLKIVFEHTGGTAEPVDAGGEEPVAAAAFESVRPNPFTADARVRFRIARGGAAQLRVYDAAGRWLRTVAAPALMPGAHEFVWDGVDAAGRRVGPGIYFYRLEAPGLAHSGKLARTR